jgi:hypothetical protein
MVVVPTIEPEVAVIVLPLPAAVGVKVGKVLNTPAVNAAEVPVAPAVPPKVTVPANILGPLLQTLPLASLAVMLVKLLLTDVPAVAEAIVVGFMTNWLIAPGLTVAIEADPVAEPEVTVTVRLVPANVGVTLAPLNTPEVKAADVPVTPAVPPNVTVEPKLVTVWPPAS